MKTKSNLLRAAVILASLCLLLLDRSAQAYAFPRAGQPMSHEQLLNSDANWDDGFGPFGADDMVTAAAMDGHGNLYIGGGFTHAGGANASALARWDGSTWTSPGAVDGWVNSIVIAGNNMYIGGFFNRAGGVNTSSIAKLDLATNTWSALGNGVSGCNGICKPIVKTMAFNGTDLYVGGSFGAAGGTTANNIAKWNGANWSGLGGGMQGEANAMVFKGSDLYVAGDSQVYRWDGNTWSTLPGSFSGSGYISALAIGGNNLYAGGSFTTVAGLSANRIARWDLTNGGWSVLGSGVDLGTNDTLVETMAVDQNGVLYAGGNFTVAGGTSANDFAKWDGTSWSAMGAGFDDAARMILVNGSDIYVGGNFMASGQAGASRIAKWDGTNKAWVGIGNSSNNGVAALGPSVYAVAIDGDNVYVGGNLRSVGSVAANGIARWNVKTSTWSALGAGVSGDLFSTVYALAVSGNKVYAGGNFKTAGGVSAPNLAAWDGTKWSPVGESPNGSVWAIAARGNKVYVGGEFTKIGNTPAAYLAEWDGNAWWQLGPPPNNPVYAIALTGSALHAGGYFTKLGSLPARHIAKCERTWSTLDGGLNGTVAALTANGDDVYVGGSFTRSGGAALRNIAKWNGTTSRWSGLSGGVDGDVHRIAVSPNGDVYVGGYLTQAGRVAVSSIAKWNGAWAPLGSGLNDSVLGLAMDGGDIYVTGSFQEAGGKPSEGIALWHDAPLAPAIPPSGEIDCPATLPVAWEQNSGGVQYDGWRSVKDPHAHGRSYRVSGEPGDSVTFRFAGTGITWLSRTGPDQGKALVRIDGMRRGPFDLYSNSAATWRRTFGGLAIGTHNIVVQVLQQKNPSSTGLNVSVDGFVVGGTTIEETSNAIQYDSWQGVPSADASGGNYRVSQQMDATASLSFTGTSVNWVTALGPSLGKAKVFIDNVAQGTVDLFASQPQWQVLKAYTNLGIGPHTLRIQVLGAKNPSSSGTKVIVDGFQTLQ